MGGEECDEAQLSAGVDVRLLFHCCGHGRQARSLQCQCQRVGCLVCMLLEAKHTLSCRAVLCCAHRVCLTVHTCVSITSALGTMVRLMSARGSCSACPNCWLGWGWTLLQRQRSGAWQTQQRLVQRLTQAHR